MQIDCWTLLSQDIEPNDRSAAKKTDEGYQGAKDAHVEFGLILCADAWLLQFFSLYVPSWELGKIHPFISSNSA